MTVEKRQVLSSSFGPIIHVLKIIYMNIATCRNSWSGLVLCFKALVFLVSFYTCNSSLPASLCVKWEQTWYSVCTFNTVPHFQVYYHLGAYDDSLTYALGAGDLFDVNGHSEYVETIIGKVVIHVCCMQAITVSICSKKVPRCLSIFFYILMQCCHVRVTARRTF